MTSATDYLQNNRWGVGKGVNPLIIFMPRRLLCRDGAGMKGIDQLLSAAGI
jgi:hypothetical protein